MFDPPATLGTQPVEPKTIATRVNFPEKASTKAGPLGWINLALKDRELNPLPEIEASPCHPAQSPSSCGGFGVHIIGYQHQHDAHLISK